MGQTLLIGAISTLIALVISTVYNLIINKPKRMREERAKAEAARKVELDQLAESIQALRNSFKKDLEKQADKDEDFKEDIVMIKKGLQAIIKNDLKLRYETWIARNYAPIDAKEDLEKLYEVYHQLGANGVMDVYRNKFLSLPSEDPYLVQPASGSYSKSRSGSRGGNRNG